MPSDYMIVDDSLRHDNETGLVRDLLDGKTVFVPDATSQSVNLLYSRFLNRYQRKLRRRSTEIEGRRGLVLWLEDPEG